MELRVPADKFEEILDSVRAVGGAWVDTENVSIADIQAQVTRSEEEIEDISGQITELEIEIKKATGAKKTQLENQLEDLKDKKLRNEEDLQKLKEGVEYAQIDVSVRQPDRLDLGFPEIGEAMAESVSFWGQLIAWLAIPLLLFVIVVKFILRVARVIWAKVSVKA